MPRSRVNRKLKGIRKCGVCEKEFEAYTHNHKYCSPNCRWTVAHSKPEQKKKRAANFQRWAVDKKDHRRNYQLQYTYGITLEKYYELLKAQDDCCAVCKRHISTSPRLFAVDHDHKTGEIFGILCCYCNRQLIGRIRKPELFLEAAKYLQKGTGLFVPERKRKKRRK